MVKNLMTGTWWMLLLRGIVAILFGILAISNVQATALVLFFWFIVFTVTDGIFSLFFALFQLNRETKSSRPDCGRGKRLGQKEKKRSSDPISRVSACRLGQQAH